MLKVVIMAGGEGERLWPLSTEHYPKQLLEIGVETPSLIQTIERFLHVTTLENIWIVTNRKLQDKIQQLCEKTFSRKISLIIEPVRKNTGFAITYAMKYLKEGGHVSEEEPILFTPCDHKIEETQALFDALRMISSKPFLERILVFGILPSGPHTSFGYIEVESATLGEKRPVLKFHEKPNIDLANLYFQSGKYFWNSGMVILSAHLLEKELQKHAFAYFEYYKGNTSIEDLPSISFDHLVLEKSDQIEAILIDVKWLDIGSFAALFSLAPADEVGNAAFAESIYTHEATENWVASHHKVVALFGVHQIAVIDTPHGLVVSDRKKLHQLKMFKEAIASKDKIKLIRKLKTCCVYELYLDKDQENYIHLKPPLEIELLEGKCEVYLEEGMHILSQGDKIKIRQEGATIKSNCATYLLLIAYDL